MNKKKVKKDYLKFGMASVMISIALASAQRPGAVCNYTIQEYENAVLEANNITIIKVRDHKTGGTSGSAKLAAKPVMAKRLLHYYQFIRLQLLDESKLTDKLFILQGSKPIKKLET